MASGRFGGRKMIQDPGLKILAKMTRMARMARTVARMAHWLADLADSY